MRTLLTSLILLGSLSLSLAQIPGGNASISVTTSSNNVALPAATIIFQYALIVPSTGTTQEIFYNLGTNSSVVATTSSFALPSGGICLPLAPTVTYIAAITAANSGTLRITQVAQCPPFANNNSGGGGGGGGITALTGDVTASGTGSVTATLATVNSNVGTFGSASLIPSITVNAKGLITAVTTNAVAGGGIIAGTTTCTSCSASGLLYSDGTFVQSLTTTNNGILITNGSGVPSISTTTLPGGLTTTALNIVQGTITTNVTGLSITATWNNAGTTFDAPLFLNVTDTAANSNSKIVDFQINSASAFSITAFGFTSTGGATIGAAGAFAWNGRGLLSSPAAAKIQFGSADSSAPVAQSVLFQNGSGSNITGVNTIIQGSLGTGTGGSGSIFLEVGVTNATGGSATNTAGKLLSLNSGTATGANVQLGDGVNFTTYDSCTALTTGATGIVACTASSRRFKDILNDLSPLEASHGLDILVAGSWTYKSQYQKQFGGPMEHVSLYADDVAAMDPRCVTYERGQVHDYYDRCVVAYLVEDRKAMKAEISDLKRRVH